MRAVVCCVLLSFPALSWAANATAPGKQRPPRLPSRAADAKTTATVKLGGRKLTLAGGYITEYEGLVIALLGNCSFEINAATATKERWEKALKGDHLRIRFAKPHTFEVTSKVEAEEIIVTLSQTLMPNGVWVRNGNRYRGFTKYQLDICLFIQGRMKGLLKAAWRADAKKKKRNQ
jgi:hypothetical protein